VASGTNAVRFGRGDEANNNLQSQEFGVTFPFFSLVSRSVRLIDRRFGPPSDQVRECVTQADPNTLLEWSDRILDASSLDEVLH
jgi:hypothetical protein